MPNIVRIKRRATGSPGAPTSLANAELAFNEVDNVLYYGKGTGGEGGTATTVDAIAGSGAFLTLSTAQTISGNKTFTGDIIVPTQATSDNSTKAASTAYVRSQGYLTGNQTITFTGDATGSGATSVALTLANSGIVAGTYTKITFDAKGRGTSGTTLADTDIPTLTAAKISNFDTQVRTNRLDQMAVPTAAVSLNSQRITNLADPTNAQDAATKNYVDATRAGLDFKDSVRAATTANITLSGAQTIDGISVVAGNRVLVKNQTTGSQNGIYDVATGAWTRSLDANTATKVSSGMFVFVEEGTVNADSGWVLTTDGTIVIDTTALNFTQFSGAGQITAGAGMTKSGNTLDVGGTANRITVSADAVDIASTYVGQSSITTLGTISSGTWNGTVISPTFGGTGVNNGSRTITIGGNLVVSGAFSTTLTVTGTTSLTLPTSGTLVNSAVTSLSSLASVGTITTGTWNASTIGVSFGGTGATTLTGVLKGNGTSAISAAVDGTDFLSPNATIDGGTF
jgi:hypothetical protein